MDGLSEVLLVVLLGLSLLMANSSRLIHCIRLVAFQGILVGLLPLAQWDWSSGFPGFGLLALVIVSVCVKGITLPLLLYRAMRMTNVECEFKPLVGYSASMAVALLVIGFSFAISSGIVPLSDASSFSVPVSISTMLLGLFLVISRRKALIQALGFLAFENGISIFGIGMSLQYSWIIELGVLLVIFALVFMMGIAVCQISREFSHTDIYRLNLLVDWDRNGKGVEKDEEVA